MTVMEFIPGFQLPAASYQLHHPRRQPSVRHSRDQANTSCEDCPSSRNGAGSRKPEAGSFASHFLRKRVPQPIEDEIPEQEEHDRDGPEDDQPLQMADGTLEKENLLVADGEMRERIQFQQCRLPD